MNIIGTRGEWADDVVIESDGQRIPLHHVVRHCPPGFDWGRCTPGTADLALSILAHFVGVEIASRHYLAYKEHVVSKLPLGDFTIAGEDVENWLVERIGVVGDAALNDADAVACYPVLEWVREQVQVGGVW